MISVNLHAPYQTYRGKADEQPATGVAFSTGDTPWNYVAAVGLGLGGDVRAAAADVTLRTEGEGVLLAVVDKAYVQVAERVQVQPKPGAQRVRVALPASAAALIVQAGAEPKDRPVVLEEVVLDNEE